MAVALSETDYQPLKRRALPSALIEGEKSGAAGELDMDRSLNIANDQLLADNSVSWDITSSDLKNCNPGCLQ